MKYTDIIQKLAQQIAEHGDDEVKYITIKDDNGDIDITAWE